VPTFQYLAKILTDKRQFDKAVEVCETAIGLGFHDGTKGGFESRISKIRKQQQRKSRDVQS
jgi:hypothetical protein